MQIHHLDFSSHPLMQREQLLAARLLALFTAYKQREATGVLAFYGERLRALEDALLDTRHAALERQARHSPSL